MGDSVSGPPLSDLTGVGVKVTSLKGTRTCLCIVPSTDIFAELGGVMVDLEIDENNTTVDRSGAESLQDGNDSGIFQAFGLTYDIENWTLAFKMSSVDTDADLTITSLNFYRHF